MELYKVAPATQSDSKPAAAAQNKLEAAEWIN
jgi:hypothetical protein